jgi:hypothetical protein
MSVRLFCGNVSVAFVEDEAIFLIENLVGLQLV